MISRRQKLFERLVRYQKAHCDQMKSERFAAVASLERAEKEIATLHKQRESLLASPNLDPNMEHWTPMATYSALSLSEALGESIHRSSHDVHSARQALADATVELTTNYARQKKYEAKLQNILCELDKDRVSVALEDACGNLITDNVMTSHFNQGEHDGTG